MFQTIKDLMLNKKAVWEMENKPRPKALADIDYYRDDEIIDSTLELNDFISSLSTIGNDISF